MDGMLNLNEVMRYLDADEKTIEKLVKRGKLHAYKLGGHYLRFPKEDVVELKMDQTPRWVWGSPFWERSIEFWRFNSFYIISLILLAVLLVLLFGV